MTRTMKPNGAKTERLQHERWEDEGGQPVALEIPARAGRFVRPLPETPGVGGWPGPWRSTFIIEPLPLGTGSGSSIRVYAGKK